MWDFIFGPEGVRSERINLIWLGMNKNFYYHLQKQEEQALNVLQISDICDKIWSSVQNKSLHLSTVSNLLKGTCMVHKAQVDFLYTETKNLFCYQQSNKRDTSSFHMCSEENTKTKRKRKSSVLFETFDSQNIFEEIENITFDNDNDNANVSNTIREQDITLKESNEKNYCLGVSDNEDKDLPDLGELTVTEKDNFMSIIKFHHKARKKKRSNSENINNIRTSDSNPKQQAENQYSFDIPRYQNTRESPFINNTNYGLIGFRKDLNENTKFGSDISINLDNILNFTSDKDNHFEVQLPEVTNNLSQHNVVLPNYEDFVQNLNNENLSVNHNEQLRNNCLKKIIENSLATKRRKTKLKVDKTKEYTAQQITLQAHSITVFRCTHPRQDIVSKWFLNFKPDDYLMNSPCLRLPSSLTPLFKKNLKRKMECEDSSIIKSVLGEEILDISNLIIKKKRKIANRFTKNKISVFNDQSNEFENVTPTSNLEFQETNLDRNICNDQCFMEELIQTFQINENFETPEQDEGSIIFRKLKNDWSPLSLLRKLCRLGIANGEQVLMQVLLCKNVSKIEAAIAFSSVIQLAAKNYIKLIKEKNSNFIAGIQIGEKIMFKSIE